MADKSYRAEKRALKEKSADKASSSLTMANVLPKNTSVVVGLRASTSEAATLPRPAHEDVGQEGAQLVRNNKRKTSEQSSKSQVDKKFKHNWDFNFASDYSITESPKSVASLLRHFRRPGFKIPLFNQFTEVNRENYIRFSGCIGQLLAEYNRTVDSYEEQLRTPPAIAELKVAKDLNSELTAQVKKMQSVVEENVKTAERVHGLVSRIKKLELERDDFKKKLQISEGVVAKLEKKDKASSGLLKDSEIRCEAFIRMRRRDISAAVCEVKKELLSKHEETLLKVKSHIDQKDVFQKSQVRVAEIKANFELLSEIVKGVIVDPQVELEEVARDKDEAIKELEEMIVPELDFKLLEFSKLSDSSPTLEITIKSPAKVQEFDEFGSNIGLLGELPIEGTQKIV